MNVLDNIRRTMESVEKLRTSQTCEGQDEFVALYEKYKDIPEDKLKEIIADVKSICIPATETVEEPVKEEIPAEETQQPEETEVSDDLVIKDETNEVDVKPAAGIPEEPGVVDTKDESEEQEDEQIDSKNELDASEADEGDEEELIISEEEDNDTVEEETIDEDDEEYEDQIDELDIVDGDKVEEPKSENAEEIKLDVPSADTGDKAAEKAECGDNSKEHTNEANTAAKAAIANRDNKGTFSSDVDALTDYLNDY